MAIIQTITDEYHFWEWLKRSDNYSNNFTIDGALALQAYLDDLSDETETTLEFDPVAWCVEYSEYGSALEAYNQQHGEDDFIKVDDGNTAENAEAQALEWLQDNTQVIELDNGGVIVADF
jgi:hypothetical protein